MENKKVKIYKLGGVKRPSNNFKQRLLLKMNNAPFLNKMKCVKKALCKEFNLPMTTSINKGFYCSAPNIEVGENTGLGNLYIRAIGKVTIGRNCSFSYNNMIFLISVQS